MKQAGPVQFAVAGALIAALSGGFACAQPEESSLSLSAGGLPAGVSAEPDVLPEELPAQVLEQLATVEDLTFDFDHPGYYAVLKFVRESPRAPGFSRPPVRVSNWQELVERPADFRGLPVTITGIVGRNKDPYVHQRHPELGAVFQTELWDPDQPIACTVVFTQDVRDLPLGATVTVTGYFVKINRYPRPSGEPGISALIVAPGPVAMGRQAARFRPDQGGWWPLGAAVAAGLFIAFVVLRSARRTQPREPRPLPASSPAPMNLARELAEWAQRELPESEGTGAKPGAPPKVTR